MVDTVDLDQGHLHPLHRASESIRCSEAMVRCETRLMRRSRESNPGLLALQANTLCKEPFEQPYLLPFRTLACTTTAPPQAAMSQALDWGSWLSLTRTRICLIGRVEVRIAREGAGRSNLSCVRGSSTLEPQSRVRIASRRGHHYVGA
jgi:hypothetical protein